MSHYLTSQSWLTFSCAQAAKYAELEKEQACDEVIEGATVADVYTELKASTLDTMVRMLNAAWNPDTCMYR